MNLFLTVLDASGPVPVMRWPELQASQASRAQKLVDRNLALLTLEDGCEVLRSLLEQPYVLLMNPTPHVCLLSFLCLTACLPHLLRGHLPIPVSESSLGDPSRTLRT